MPSTSPSTSNRVKSLCGVIYPDDPNFNNYLSFLKTQTYFYILHDKDFKEVENENIQKKPHVHFLCRWKNAVSLKAFLNAMKIPENYVERCTSSKSYVRYMTHIDEPDKFQYKIDDIKTNDPLFKASCFDELSHENFMVKFLHYISCKNGTIYSAEVLSWALNNGYYENYFRNYKIIRDIISQENERRLTKYVAKENVWQSLSDEDEVPF